MKNNFLTIPDTNYEINSDLVVRNKITGNFIKQSAPGVFVLKNKDKNFCSTGAFLRRQAEDAVKDNDFYLILSTDGKYEINSRGIVRHTRIKRPLKLRGHQYSLTLNGKVISRSVNTLLIETFGRANSNARPRVPVILNKGDRRVYFNTITDAAVFIAKKYFYSVSCCYQRIRANKLPDGWSAVLLL